MNDDAEAILKQLTPRGAGPTLRTRVLDAVAEHLPNAPPMSDRPAAAFRFRWDRWAAVGVAASVLLALGLNLGVARLGDARLAAIYGPELVPRYITEIADTIASVTDAEGVTRAVQLVVDTGAGHALSLELDDAARARLRDGLVTDTVVGWGANGPLRGDIGRVRALIDDRGRPTREAGPSTPVEVLGLSGLPQPGDTFQALTDAAKARQIALYRQTLAKEKALVGRSSRLTLESLQQQALDLTVERAECRRR